ncbi:ABC-2 family transporter protein [Paenibacillus athensensis]|uniref:ABC transporter permease n=1 Tax=Paenibacillus athensensis TaxID=1967502 RepID=A0A4Y8PYV1_9BACL|nr:ABC-2 family transporter protein [Paenibacillus athensensis]MCD1259366.1 ABC-2 family transporter protein [Paenibacillus athensensis]
MKKYLKSFQLGVLSSLEYRVNFLISMVSGIFPILIQYYMWTAIFNNNSGDTVYGYTYAQLISYTIMATLVAKLVRTGFEYDVAEDIKNGGINKFIVKPIHYFQFRLFSFLGQKIVYFTMTLLLIGVILFILNVYLDLHLAGRNMLLFIATLVLSVLLNFLIFYIISITAFWLGEVTALFEALRIFILVLSGGMFPLDIFGASAVKVLSALPFSYLIYFPVNVLNGKIPLEEIAYGIAVQAIWIIILTLSSSLIWRAGTKKYIAIGG